MNNLNKICLFFSVLFFSVNQLTAQFVIDDFSSGKLINDSYRLTGPTDLYQKGNMVGNIRMLRLHISKMKDNQHLQVSVLNNKLIASFGYNTKGVLKVNYGNTKSGLNPLNLDLSKYKVLKIKFESKSSPSSINVSLFTNNDYSSWADHIKSRDGELIVSIPLKSFKKSGKNFTFKDVDYIRFQFNADSVTGHNFAIEKIWFE